jgi:serine/threonine-protein kinase
MEFLEGQTLAARLANGPLPLAQALTYGMQIADALSKAHHAGILHRDLKPGNVMITRSGGPSGPPVAKLLDFGPAKLKVPADARALDRDEATPISGTQGAESPFFSPDGQWVAFWSDHHLRKVPLAGGPAAVICELRDWPPFGASWGADGTIVFSRETGGLLRVSSAGGAPTELTTLVPGERNHRLPQFLPGGDAVLFTALTRSSTWGDEEIPVFSFKDRTRKTLVAGADGRYVTSGHLIFMRLGTLMAVPFDRGTLEVTGAPVGMMEDVAQVVNENTAGLRVGVGQFAVSESGALAWVRGGVMPPEQRTLVWVDRRGAVSPVPITPANYRTPRLSPDGRRVAVPIGETTRLNLWIYDLERGTLTSLPSDSEDVWPVWSRDGREIVFASVLQGTDTLHRRLADRTSVATRLAEGHRVIPVSWSADGTTLAFVQSVQDRSSNTDIWVLAASGRDPSARPLRTTPFAEQHPEWSPDGRWLAYTSNQTGRFEVYLQPYPGPGAQVQVSTGGGSSPAWSPPGRELFYVVSRGQAAGRARLMAVDVVAPPTLGPGLPRTLFEFDPVSLVLAAVPSRNYDVTRDGQRFIAAMRVTDPDRPVTHINVVLNWFEELKAKAPARR